MDSSCLADLRPLSFPNPEALSPDIGLRSFALIAANLPDSGECK
jgi:hypothetical protein